MSAEAERKARLTETVDAIEVRGRRAGCGAVLNVEGEHFECVEPAEHFPLAHRNPAARATWVGDLERWAIEDFQRKAQEAGL